MIYEILKPGKENAMTAAVIAATLNYPVRKVSERVMTERRQGKPICSNQHGYYLAETKKDIEDQCGRLRHRAGEIFKTRRALLRQLQPAEETTEKAADK